jgi:hypothetical protein
MMVGGITGAIVGAAVDAARSSRTVTKRVKLSGSYVTGIEMQLQLTNGQCHSVTFFSSSSETVYGAIAQQDLERFEEHNAASRIAYILSNLGVPCMVKENTVGRLRS